jgi:glucosyl-3-phosphoglycerate phosphatase
MPQAEQGAGDGASTAAAGTAAPGTGPAGTGPAGTGLAGGPGAAPAELAAGRAPGPGRGNEAVHLVLWRHGQSVWNAERRWQGQSDPPLSPLGEQQARRAARLLAALGPAAIYSSDLRRAADTAGQLARVTGIPVQIDKNLRERGGGSWEGLTGTEIQARYPAAWAARFPSDGEHIAAVAERVAEVMERVADGLEAGSRAVVVSHGAALNMGMSRLLGLPEDVRVLGVLGNCSWSVLGRHAGSWRLLEHNVGTLPEPVPESPPGTED